MQLLCTDTGPTGQLLLSIIAGTLLTGGLASILLLARYHRRTPPDRPMLTAALAARAWNTFQVGGVLGALLLLSLLAPSVISLLGENQSRLTPLATVLIFVCIMALVARINHKQGDSRETRYGMSMRQIKTLLLAPVLYLALMPFLMLVSAAYHLLLEHAFGIEITVQDVALGILRETSWVKILYMTAAILAAPIYEELLFRGIVFPYLVKRMGLAGGLACVSALFAAMHFHLPSLAPLFLLSLALGLAYWRTGSLWVSIGIHAIFNTVSILALILMDGCSI